MFLEERYEYIIKELNLKGRVAVKELSEELAVTEDCIRKDLKQLELNELLTRVYGGAVKVRQNNKKMQHITERINNITHEKEEIASKAMTLIKEKDRIFLDTSSINLLLAKKIIDSNFKITVVTNMIDIALVLGKCMNIKLIVIGGGFNSNVNGVIGDEAQNNIGKYTYDKAFIGVCGVNLENRYISTSDIEDGNTKKAIIENSKEVYLVMEKDKFNYDEFYKFINLDKVKAIITEDNLDENIEILMKDNGIEKI